MAAEGLLLLGLLERFEELTHGTYSWHQKAAHRLEPRLQAAKFHYRALWPHAFLQIFDRLADGGPIDSPLLIGVSKEEAVIAHNVDEPGNPTRILRDAVHCGVG